jgi:hypothetical protein
MWVQALDKENWIGSQWKRHNQFYGCLSNDNPYTKSAVKLESLDGRTGAFRETSASRPYLATPPCFGRTPVFGACGSVFFDAFG